ncbi:ligand-dependent corepressor [Syngnathus acus]|uniref:ligand-dependent corepressor n=1 Tax=Syngnathus acus TaxID=161584 RepID=UPI001885DDFD|nr:ligand-dependent corepressor [Syngnathus acus]
MASLCKRQQCTLERRGFRQELDSWRHKLIHCVGFESILEGLFGPGVVQDSPFSQDCEPEEVSDWSFDDNCLFCCLRVDKVKDHRADDTVAGDGRPPAEGDHAKREESRLGRLERQAQDFLNAVFHRKDLPSLSDPHIPLVAREIMQRMIRQFAAEYTSKSTQDAPLPPNGAMKDQSLPPCSPAPGSPPSPASCSSPSPCLSPPGSEGPAAAAAAASAQNPVLSKLLMADQDGPLDLTVKKNPAESDAPAQQDGVLDLSTRKNQNDKQGFSLSEHGLKGHPPAKADHRAVAEANEEDGAPPAPCFRDGFGDDGSFKPPLARSLRIKEELLSQKHRLLGQPAALSLASLESSAALLNHGQSHSLLGQKGSSSSFWGSKAHLESLMKLKQASPGDLKDLPTFLENHHKHHGAFSFKNSLLQHHHNPVSKTQHHRHHHHAKRDHSPPVDLKIPQVRGMDLSWDSPASELYAFGGPGGGGGNGGLGENALSRKLRAILPKQNRRGGSLGSLLDGAAEYWAADLEHSASGPAYPTSDAEGDPNSKQPRKKRGRYRQYNSEILEEAIAVVMSGKMSVSKAQNMYGIPHSTLEYKVKERMGTLKNPPKKKLKLMMKTEAAGPEFPATDADNPPADEAGPAELKADVEEEIEPVQ